MIVSEMLGHSSGTISLRIYSHVLPHDTGHGRLVGAKWLEIRVPPTGFEPVISTLKG